MPARGAAVQLIAGRIDNEQTIFVQYRGSVSTGDYQQTGADAELSVDGHVHATGFAIDGGRTTIGADGVIEVAGDFVQTGTQTSLTVNGRLATIGLDTGVRVQNGELEGSGLIQGQVFVGCGAPGSGSTCAFARPGNSPGTLTIDGSLVVGDGGEMDLEVALDGSGHLVWDRVVASHISFLAGSTIRFVIGSGVLGAHPPTFDFFSCGSGCSLDSGLHWAFDGVTGGKVLFDSSGLQLTLNPVPEPRSGVLMLAGLAGVCGFVGRRRWRDAVLVED